MNVLRQQISRLKFITVMSLKNGIILMYDMVGLPHHLRLQILHPSCTCVQKIISVRLIDHVTCNITSSVSDKTCVNTISAHSQHAKGWSGAEGHGQKGCSGWQGPSHSQGAIQPIHFPVHRQGILNRQNANWNHLSIDTTIYIYILSNNVYSK